MPETEPGDEEEPREWEGFWSVLPVPLSLSLGGAAGEPQLQPPKDMLLEPLASAAVLASSLVADTGGGRGAGGTGSTASGSGLRLRHPARDFDASKSA